jgi:hypothetical protein
MRNQAVLDIVPNTPADEREHIDQPLYGQPPLQFDGLDPGRFLRAKPTEQAGHKSKHGTHPTKDHAAIRASRATAPSGDCRDGHPCLGLHAPDEGATEAA